MINNSEINPSLRPASDWDLGYVRCKECGSVAKKYIDICDKCDSERWAEAEKRLEDNPCTCQDCGVNKKSCMFGNQHHEFSREDRYGIFIGYYCDKCWEPKREHYDKWEFDEDYCGERLEPEGDF